MNIFVRRSIIIYVLYSLSIFAIAWRSFFSAAERTIFENIFLRIILLPLAITIVLRLLLTPYYMVVENGELTIYRDFFIRESFKIEKLVKVELSTTPFKSSYFILDNHSRFEFNDFYVTGASFDDLIKKLAKPVEYI
jgi:hypothetical protein